MTQLKNKQSGFTLVELAIVMIVIGLLIGGILRGQELIQNASITSTAANLRAVESGIAGFQGRFDELPGDLGNAAARIPACVNACARAGDGNGTIGNDPGLAHADIDNENGAAWAHLASSNFLGGVDTTAAVGTAPVPGVSIPEIDLGNGSGMQIGFTGGGLTAETAAAAIDAPNGHWVLIDASNAAVSSAATASLTPAQAESVDIRLDDGAPNTGLARAMGTVGATTCVDVNAAAGIYRSAQDGLICGLYYRVFQ